MAENKQIFMLTPFERELKRLKTTARSLDKQVITIFIAASFLLILQFSAGSRTFFREHIAFYFDSDWQGLLGWVWWFSFQGLSGFLVPVLILVFFFKRNAREIGLGGGDVKFASLIALLYLPIILVGTWILSDHADFRAAYPHFRQASSNWQFFLLYELFYVVYWIGWEYMWRGFLLFGTAHRFGVYSIFIQALPFTLLHLQKPVIEAVLAVIGGIALGALVWRCNSFWIAVPIHSVQMLLLDLWSTLRIRTGISGIGWNVIRSILDRI